MRLIKLIMVFVAMMLSLGMLSQSAAAFDAVGQDCQSCHEQVVVDKITVVDSRITGAVDTKWERQTGSAIILATKQVIAEKKYNQSIIIADYRTGFKSRPGWQA